VVVIEEDDGTHPSRESDIPGVMVDPVDEIIEHVIGAGGSGEFVAVDALAPLGRSACCCADSTRSGGERAQHERQDPAVPEIVQLRVGVDAHVGAELASVRPNGDRR
jgi:hypothetical protein